MLKKLFCPQFTNFQNKLESLVPGKLFQPSQTNTVAEYENPLITDKKGFITLAPGRQCPSGSLQILFRQPIIKNFYCLICKLKKAFYGCNLQIFVIS
jgi:hypothetical protein